MLNWRLFRPSPPPLPLKPQTETTAAYRLVTPHPPLNPSQVPDCPSRPSYSLPQTLLCCLPLSDQLGGAQPERSAGCYKTKVPLALPCLPLRQLILSSPPSPPHPQTPYLRPTWVLPTRTRRWRWTRGRSWTSRCGGCGVKCGGGPEIEIVCYPCDGGDGAGKGGRRNGQRKEKVLRGHASSFWVLIKLASPPSPASCTRSPFRRLNASAPLPPAHPPTPMQVGVAFTRFQTRYFQGVGNV